MCPLKSEQARRETQQWVVGRFPTVDSILEIGSKSRSWLKYCGKHCSRQWSNYNFYILRCFSYLCSGWEQRLQIYNSAEVDRIKSHPTDDKPSLTNVEFLTPKYLCTETIKSKDFKFCTLVARYEVLPTWSRLAIWSPSVWQMLAADFSRRLRMCRPNPVYLTAFRGGGFV